MSRPSVFFDNADELRDEYDWMYEFMGRMAERIRGDADVHSLADYVQKLEDENAKLRELIRHMHECIERLDRTDKDGGCILCPYQEVEYDCEFKQRMRELGIEVD